jgi:hypothetical protein
MSAACCLTTGALNPLLSAEQRTTNNEQPSTIERERENENYGEHGFGHNKEHG